MNSLKNIFLFLLFVASLHAVNTAIVSRDFVGQDADLVFLDTYIKADKDVELNAHRAAAQTVACNGRMKAGKALLDRQLVIGNGKELVRTVLKQDAKRVAKHFHDKAEAQQILGELKRNVL